MTLRELLERRAAIAAEMRTILDKPSGENGDLSAEQSTRFDALKSEMAGLERRVERQSVLEEAERRMQGTPLTNHPGQFSQMVGEFRLAAALAGLAGIPGVDFGREREVSQELARRSGRDPRGLFVPMEALVERRALQANAMTQGGALTVTQTADVIEPLRARTVCGKLGATFLTDLVGALEIPRITTPSTTAWVAEGVSLTSQTGPRFGSITMAPRTVGALVEFSRKLLLSTSISVENLLRRDLTEQIGIAVDAAAMAGSGTGAEPRGILNTPNVRSLAFNSTATAANLATDIAAVIATPPSLNVISNTLGWAMNPRVPAFLTALRDANSNRVYPNVAVAGLEGYPVATTTSLPTTNGDTKANGIFGNWSDLFIGMWGVMDLTANPYGDAFKRGGVEIRAMLDCDVSVRYPESFVRTMNMPISALAV
ncbi:phage major capsid protein [Paracraurococcus ruber]|nr:phage major capsid protein [Paracraurococcus ruber]